MIQFSSVQFVSVTQSCSILCDPMNCSTRGFPAFTVSRSLLKLRSFESVMQSNHLILCCPLLLPSTFPSIRVFSNESGLHIQWPKYWSFSFNISPSSEHSGLISFRTDWFDLLVDQRRDSEESSLAPQVKSINSLAFSLLYGPTLTSIPLLEKL